MCYSVRGWLIGFLKPCICFCLLARCMLAVSSSAPRAQSPPAARTAPQPRAWRLAKQRTHPHWRYYDWLQWGASGVACMRHPRTSTVAGQQHCGSLVLATRPACAARTTGDALGGRRHAPCCCYCAPHSSDGVKTSRYEHGTELQQAACDDTLGERARCCVCCKGFTCAANAVKALHMQDAS